MNDKEIQVEDDLSPRIFVPARDIYSRGMRELRAYCTPGNQRHNLRQRTESVFCQQTGRRFWRYPGEKAGHDIRQRGTFDGRSQVQC